MRLGKIIGEQQINPTEDPVPRLRLLASMITYPEGEGTLVDLGTRGGLPSEQKDLSELLGSSMTAAMCRQVFMIDDQDQVVRRVWKDNSATLTLGEPLASGLVAPGLAITKDRLT